MSCEGMYGHTLDLCMAELRLAQMKAEADALFPPLNPWLVLLIMAVVLLGPIVFAGCMDSLIYGASRRRAAELSAWKAAQRAKAATIIEDDDDEDFQERIGKPPYR